MAIGPFHSDVTQLLFFIASISDSGDFTHSLANATKFNLGDVHRLAQKLSATPASKLDKVYKFFVEQYLFDYKVKSFVSAQLLAAEMLGLL